MQLRPDRSAPADGSEQAPTAPATDVLSGLAARVEAVEGLVRATAGIADEKTLKELRRTIDALAKRDPKFEERLTHRVDVLADRIETVAKTVSISSSANAAKDGELVQLRRELEAGLVRAEVAAASPRGVDPAALAELRQDLDDLAKMTKQRMPRGLESRVDELAAKFTLVAQRIDSVSATVSTTAAGLAGREGDINALRRAFDSERAQVSAELAEIKRGVDPQAVAGLRQGLKELSDESGRRQHASRQLIGQVADKVDQFGGRVETLVGAQTSTSDRVAAIEQHLVAFRKYVEDSNQRANALLTEQHGSLAALAAGTKELEQVDTATARAIDEGLTGLGGELAQLAGRLESLERADDEATRAVDERVAVMSGELAQLARRVESVEQADNESTHAVDEHVAVVDRGLAQLTGRLESLEQADDETASAVDERVSEIGARLEEVARRLDPLAASVTETTEHLDTRDAALEKLEQRFEEASARVDGLVADLSQALSALPDPERVAEGLTPRIDELAEQSTFVANRLTRLETTLTEQLQATASSAEIEQLLADNSDTLRGLYSRVDELTSALEAASSRVTSADEDVSALRAYVDDAGRELRAWLTGHERALAGHDDAMAALDAQSAALERASTDTTTALDARVTAAKASVDELERRVEPLAASVEQAVTRLEAKEHELSELHRQLTDSSARVENVAGDVRDVLAALSTSAPDAVEELDSRVELAVSGLSSLASRVEQIETGRLAQQTDLTERLDRVDSRIAAVAAEMVRARALWPVALRSLEARLDDLGSNGRPPAPAAPPTPDDTRAADGNPLAGLRDSLRAMETVAAEIGKASDALDGNDDAASAQGAVAAGSGTIVPLRTADP